MISPEEFQSDVCWPVLCIRRHEMIIQLPSAIHIHPSTLSCKHFSLYYSEDQGLRASLVNQAAHALGEVNVEHGRSSLKLVWPWFKSCYISIVMDFQCLFCEWEPLKWNNTRCYRSVCWQGYDKGRQDGLLLRGCTIKPPRSVKYYHYRHASLMFRVKFSSWPSDQLKNATLLSCDRSIVQVSDAWKPKQPMRSEVACKEKQRCPRQRFKDILKTYLSTYNLPWFSALSCREAATDLMYRVTLWTEVFWTTNQGPP